MTGPQRALADFLKLDADLLATAAETSLPLTQVSDRDAELAAWIGSLPTAEKDALLLRAVQGTSPLPGPELLARFTEANAQGAPAYAERRSAAQLLDAAHSLRTQRAQRQA
ncbi:hypothetical protein [Streptomyces sp. NPDC051219]|uniref:hypothetical protein n=1 Tax=Streptomyces sp. NPDC051219 TaxID=3155283 RepID=UPI00342D8628